MKLHRVLFFLLLALLPVQLGYHLWPEWAHVLGRRVDYLAPTLYLTDLLIVGIVGSALIDRKLRLPFRPAFLGVVAVAALTIAQAARPEVALYAWIKVAEYALLASYIRATKPALLQSIQALSVGVVCSVILAVVQIVLGHSVGGLLWFVGERTFDAGTPGIAKAVLDGREVLRPYATFPHPNVLGGFVAALMPLLVFASLRTRSRFFALVLVIAAAGLALTFSRSAMLVGAFAGLTTYMLLTKKHPWVVLVPLTLLAAGLFVLLPLSAADESVIVRTQLMDAALRIWGQSPILGAGLGNFLVRLPEFLAVRQVYFLQPVHNIYLLLLSEVGIVGLGLFLVLLAAAFRRSSSVPLRIALAALLLLGLVDHYPITLQQGQLLFVFLLSATMAS